MLALLVAALLLPSSVHAQEHAQAQHDSSPGAAAMGFDAVLLRPIGFLALVAGSLMFVPVALITYPNGQDSVDEALDTFVSPFVEDVFRRPLGDF